MRNGGWKRRNRGWKREGEGEAEGEGDRTIRRIGRSLKLLFQCNSSPFISLLILYMRCKAVAIYKLLGPNPKVADAGRNLPSYL